MDNLATSLQGLVSEVQNTMASVHSVDTAVLRQDSYEWYHPTVLVLRRTLGELWVEILDVLQKSYKLTGDLAFVGRSKQPLHSRVLFVQTQIKPIAEVEKGWQDLIPRNDKIWKDFDASIPRLEALQQSNNDPAANSIRSVAPGLCAETHQFVRMSLAAANPPLLPSVTSVLESLQNTSKHLTSLSECWVGVRSICEIVAGGTPQTPGGFEQQCKKYLSPWEVNREGLLDAIGALTLSIDAISIHAPPPCSDNGSPTLSKAGEAQSTVKRPSFPGLRRYPKLIDALRKHLSPAASGSANSRKQVMRSGPQVENSAGNSRVNTTVAPTASVIQVDASPSFSTLSPTANPIAQMTPATKTTTGTPPVPSDEHSLKSSFGLPGAAATGGDGKGVTGE